MSNFEDGSYGSLPGIALIGKVLAGRCQMRYTRAAVGKGYIPEGMTPKTMEEPPDYVMDAKIASVTTPVDGECQVTVQIRSDEVETGFYITSIVLYAEDPELGEIPYTYLSLENEPEWIRPASSVVGKLATFDLIVAVGDVDAVSAIIDPEAVATVGWVEQNLKRYSRKTIIFDIMIPKTGWVRNTDINEDTDIRHVDVPLEDITEDTIPMLSIYPQDLDVARKCGMCPTVRALNGILRIYSEKPPSMEIHASLALLHGNSAASPIGPANVPGVSYSEYLDFKNYATKELRDLANIILGRSVTLSLQTQAGNPICTQNGESIFATVKL